MAGVGELLRSGREAAGLTVDELARMTRLSVSAVKALEEEDWESLPDMVFVRGFVYSCARAVGIDERTAGDALARSADRGFRQERVLPRLPEPTGILLGSRRKSVRPGGLRSSLLLLAVAALIVAMAVLWFNRSV